MILNIQIYEYDELTWYNTTSFISNSKHCYRFSQHQTIKC